MTTQPAERTDDEIARLEAEIEALWDATPCGGTDRENLEWQSKLLPKMCALVDRLRAGLAKGRKEGVNFDLVAQANRRREELNAARAELERLKGEVLAEGYADGALLEEMKEGRWHRVLITETPQAVHFEQCAIPVTIIRGKEKA